MNPLTKSRLRTKILKLRRSLSPEEKASRSRMIHEKLARWPQFQKAQVVLFYYPLADEVDLLPLLSKSLRQKTVLLPYILDPQKKEMLAAPIRSLAEITPGAFGIPAPQKLKAFPLEQIDLILVPAVAFDRQKNRLGRGKGFYDLFLKKCQARDPKNWRKRLGIAFDLQICQKIPTGKDDQRVYKIITEQRQI